MLSLFTFTFALVLNPMANHAMTEHERSKMTPDDVIMQLKAGNERFVKGNPTPRVHNMAVAATANGQYPMAAVLSCLDSRVVPELVFDRGIGDLFVGRIAGNYETADMLGSFEFATSLAGAKVLVVLGHTHCGAVKGACDGVELGHLTDALANIEPAVKAAHSHVEGDKSSKNDKFVHHVAHLNVKQTVKDIKQRSAVISDLVEAGKLKVVGALYDIETGKVTWLDDA